MEIATSQLPRIWRLALIGAATAFAWIALSLLLGLGSGSAHADEGDDEGTGVLGAVTSAVDRTATTVTTTVTKTTSAVTEVVNTVVEVAPAPVQQPVQQVVQTVGTTVNTVTQPVVEVVSNDVVGTVTAPVVDVVTQVPVVGGIVTGTGLDRAVSDLGDTVDEVMQGEYKTFLLGIYDEICAKKKPVYSTSTYGISDKRFWTQRLLLPLSSDGVSVDKVLACQVFVHSSTLKEQTVRLAQENAEPIGNSAAKL